MKSKLEWILSNYPVDGYDGGLTEEQAKDLCVEMWNEMAENVYENKEDSKLIGVYKPYLDCFACEYYTSSCSGCQFDILFDGCMSSNSPFEKWFIAENRTHSGCDSLKKYSIEIADLFIDYGSYE
jgi:hypothetical protein